MIQITITCADNLIKGFSVQGHAGFKPEGEDIYCAGVSAITQTALLGLIRHLGNEPVYRMEKGFLSCSLPEQLNENEILNAQIILTTMEAGLTSLQEAYPEYIKVIKRRCM
jgi:uncharacterized protein YsxB (DUF464 family)